MGKCQCMQQTDQSDPTNTTEQFCGYTKGTATFACEKDCGECHDKDPKKCNHGCPTLKQPAKHDTDAGGTTKKPKKPKKPDAPAAAASTTTRWWLWPLVLLVILLVVGGIIFIVGSPSSTTTTPNTSALPQTSS